MSKHKRTTSCGPCGAEITHGVTLCAACLDDLTNVLDDMPLLAAALDAAYLRQQRFSVPGRGGTNPDESALPFHDHAGKLRRQLSTLLLDVTIGLHLDPTAHHPTTRRLVDLILETPAHLAGHPHAARWHTGLLRLHGKILTAVDMPPDLVYLGACGHHDCDEDLYAEWGADHATCRRHGCGHVHDVARRRDQLVVSVKDQLADAATIARGLAGLAIPVTATRIRQWKTRRLVEQRGTNRTGQPLYRVGDVIDRYLTEAERNTRKETG